MNARRARERRRQPTVTHLQGRLCGTRGCTTRAEHVLFMHGDAGAALIAACDVHAPALMVWGELQGYGEGLSWEASAYGAVLEELEKMWPGAFEFKTEVAV
jgi:hypothetical protein